MNLHIETPLILSDAISTIMGCRVWLKLEALQNAGSFKIRGIGHACRVHAEKGCTGFVASSGGNAGLATAYAGRLLSLPVRVYVPETTTPHAIALIREQKAEVIVHGADWSEANARAQHEQTATEAFIHPFDDPLLWEGHASIIDEVARTGVRPDVLIASVGGGGLLCGLAQGLDRAGWQTGLVAVETRGADSYAQARDAGQPVSLERITSLASSLGALQVCDQALTLHTTRPVQSLLVSDEQAVRACARFLHDHRILVEPACGAALAAVYDQVVPAAEIVVIVCGGATTPVHTLQKMPGWLN